jgi:hypothetical protein
MKTEFPNATRNHIPVIQLTACQYLDSAIMVPVFLAGVGGGGGGGGGRGVYKSIGKMGLI